MKNTKAAEIAAIKKAGEILKPFIADKQCYLSDMFNEDDFQKMAGTTSLDMQIYNETKFGELNERKSELQFQLENLEKENERINNLMGEIKQKNEELIKFRGSILIDIVNQGDQQKLLDHFNLNEIIKTKLMWPSGESDFRMEEIEYILGRLAD